MKLNELNPKPEPAWRAKLVEFWARADQRQQLDMQFYIQLQDAAAVHQLLETWDQPVLERKRKKKAAAQKKFKYGQFGGWFYPGYHYGTGSDGGSDGGDGGGESVNEQSDNMTDVVTRFAASCADHLGLKNPPQIKLKQDPEWTRRNGTFGRYTADPENKIELAVSGRHIIDVLRTLAHEMTHALQNEREGLPDHAGETGSPFEDEANALAGRIMRHWADQEPDMFKGVELEEDWRQRMGGAALAAACVAGTPGCATTGDLVRGAQIAGRAAQTMQGHDIRDIARAEAEQELRNYLRARRGDANAQNLSRIYQQQKRQVQNESSGYIPTEAEKNDPRYSMALTADIRPGEINRQAKKMGWPTDTLGRPPVLKTNGQPK